MNLIDEIYYKSSRGFSRTATLYRSVTSDWRAVQNPGVGGGGKCRFHGGASTGRPTIHGYATKQAKLDRDWARLLLGVLHTLHGGKSSRCIKPGHLTVLRAAELIKAKAS